ncbi:sentrin-specific protease 1-like [Olea europaea subsp. europaea]|uniref:Sentrin-specific protease 1-like n=1 Tax=Olea europaea subsp. europaea TaxID=158383 RepID=A0A8S0R5H1_OLEEU|nr:sentrin-specific protease 1-like [Olea europaea subsp. europaea]
MSMLEKKNGNYIFNQELVDYVEGTSPVLVEHWSNCRFLYVTYCASGSYWFAFKIDLMERTIYIYDSLPKHINAAQMVEFMKLIQVVVPWLIKVHIAYEENFHLHIPLSESCSS